MLEAQIRGAMLEGRRYNAQCLIMNYALCIVHYIFDRLVKLCIVLGILQERPVIDL